MTDELSASGTFWRFSLAFYGDEHVQRACLTIQDRCGADVNIALYLLFRAHNGDRLEAAVVEALDEAMDGWRRDVVIPLRSIRTRMKPLPYGVDAEGQARLRNIIKKAELDAEKLEQFHLESLAPAACASMLPEAAARENLAAYGRRLSSPFPTEVIEVLLGRLAELPDTRTAT